MNLLKLRGGILIILGVLALLVLPAAAATTQIHIVKYAQDNTTILAEQTVNYSWMSANLPVLGDGTTHYYHQGPVFVDDASNETHEQELRWNPAEDTNVDTKDMGAVKGTNLKDLCDLVGGMSAGEEVKVLSVDGWSDRYAYKNVYQYSSREGPLGICWYQDGKFPDTGYSDGMRLVWFADTSVNPGGLHAFGNYDWHEAAAPEYWYYYNSGSEYYPTTTGLSGKYVNRIFIYSNDAPPVAPVAAFTAVPVTGAAPLTVRFTDQSAGTPTSWAWDVNNDGTTDTTTQNATYTYTTAGNYTVNLTVRNTAGSDTEVKTGYITVTAAGARTWYVDDSGGADFTTIQAAVNAASPGDIIKVGDGTYRENVQIDRKVTLEAANRGMARIIPVNANVPVIKVVADRVTIRGMEIRGTEFSRYRCIWGISLNSAANCTIEECEILNSNWGIYLTDARDCTVRDTIITDGYRAIQVCGGSHDNLIEGNFLSWNADYAIWAEGTNNNRFVRNRMHGAEGGGAIDLRNACNNTITENVIDCYIPQGYQGICVESGSTNNTIYLNDFLGNKYLASDLGGPNVWNATTLVNYTWNNQTRTGYPGNYWQQVTNGYGYTGSDSDGDGLGDTPYTLHNSDESDLHPLIRPVAGYLPGEETEPTWIIITPELPTIVTGETRPFSARYSDRHGVRLYDLPVNWSCNNLTVGTVDNNGLFTAAGPGTALVTAAAGTVTASTRVTVVQRTPQEGNATIIVDRAGRGNYTTISAAVAAARAGDRIIVHPGTYTESVQITTPVSIVGESGAGSTAIQATDTSGPCLTVLCNGVEVTGFSLSGAKYAPAVLVKGTSRCRIAGVMVEGCNEAIRLDGSWNTSIVNLSITGCDKGIVLVNGSNGNRIEGCAVSWTEDYSIWIEEGTNNRVAGNVLSDSKGGGAIALVRSDANTVTGNDFICPYEGYHGVFLWQSAENRISVNNFRQSIIPVFSAESTNFWDTKTPVPYSFDGVKNTSRLGNYWEIVPPTGYTGSDKDGDGIGDTAYNVPYSNDVDTHPLMEKIDQYTLGILPVAAFTSDVQTGTAPLTVRFTDQSAGTPTSWAWDMNNDGTIDNTTQNAAYTYATAGNYTVNLTVTNADGSDSEVKTGYIIVQAGVPPVWNADTGVQYATIQEAVTAASAGNTIVVSNGSYTENVAINVRITIRSEHGNLTTTVTAASPTLPVFDVNANGVVVQGFTVRGPTNEHVAGIEIVGFNDCLVTGNDCSLCYNGIHIGETGMNNTVTENYCHANTRRGISLRDSAHDNLIIMNTVEDNADAGICIKDTPYDNIVWLNNIIGNRVEILTANTAHSPDTVTYVYNGNRYTHYLGNYYYDYTGTDSDGNGVGNTAYTSGSFYTDSYPLMAKNTNYGDLTPPAPVANFTSDVQAGPATLTVNFTDQSTGSPTTWAWDVNNDGLVDSTVQNPSHTYTTAGTYTVNLTVANAGGSDSEVKTDYITVSVPAPALLWGPYLTGTTTTGTVVNAKTSVATNLTVDYATDAFYTAHAAYDKNTTDGVSTQLHHIALPGLSPGTRYHYRVVYDGIATHDLTFSTFPEHGTFTFVMYSDTQDQLPTFSQLERHKLVADRIAQEPDVAFVLNSGDLVNDAANLSNWDRYFAAGKMMMANTTVYPALGNHDANNTNYYQAYGVGEYYSFDCADSHIAILDSNDYAWSDLPVQSAWLANDLKGEKQFKFVSFHHPLYTSETKHFGGWTNLREAWEGILNRCNVAAVFNGHVHAYERFLVNDTSYFVAGIGGAPSYNLASPRAPGSLKSLEYALGYIKVTVDPSAGTATAQMIRVADVSSDLKTLTTIYPAGTVFETVIINRTAPQQNESFLSLPSASLPAGMTKTVPVKVNNITQASGIAMNLDYDPTVMHITNISLHSTLAGGTLYTSIDNTTGSVKIAITLTDALTITEPTGMVDLTILATGTPGTSTTLNVTRSEWTDARAFINTSFSRVTTGTVGITTRGDLNHNGEVDIGDVAWVAYMVVGRTPVILPDADFNNNGRVEVSDAAKIAWFYVGKIPAL